MLYPEVPVPFSCQHSAASVIGVFLYTESCGITTVVHVRLFFFLSPNPYSKDHKVLCEWIPYMLAI